MHRMLRSFLRLLKGTKRSQQRSRAQLALLLPEQQMWVLKIHLQPAEDAMFPFNT